MSDTYSVQSLPVKTDRREAPVQWVNANIVLQQVLQQLDADDRKAMVIRCDELPLLRGPEVLIKTIFSDLLQLILKKKGSIQQIFLHIYGKMEWPDSAATPIGSQYLIQFSTNIQPCADWMQEHRQQLAELMVIVQKNQGSLTVAEAEGCFFSLSLPGKSL